MADRGVVAETSTRLHRPELLNKGRALDLMEEHGLDAIVGTTSENVNYLTGHVGWARRVYRNLESYAVLTKDPRRGSELIIGRADATYYAAEGGYAEAVHSYGGRSAVVVPDSYRPATEEERLYLQLQESGATFRTGLEALLHVLRGRGLNRGRIAVDQEGCPPSVLAALKEQLPECEILEGANLLLMIRLVKTEAELDLMRRAAKINEDAINDMLAFLQPGVTENEAAEVWRQTVARPGGMWHWLHFGSGARSVYVFPPSVRKLQKGDLFMFDAGLLYRNYNADTGGCGSIGEPSRRTMKEFTAVEVGVGAALDSVKAGVTGGQIYITLLETIRKSGLPAFDASFAGHTIGLEAREFPFTLSRETKYEQPFLPATSEIPLPVNATINIEAPVGVMGRGGYQIEHTIVVKQDGWEPLIPQDRSFRVIRA